MTVDFYNGLNIVPLDEHSSVLSRAASSVANHPWRDLYERRGPPPPHSSKTPSTNEPPITYRSENDLDGPSIVDDTVAASPPQSAPVFSRGFGRTNVHHSERLPPRGVELHETIGLSDVEAFITKTADKARATLGSAPIDPLTAGFSRLSTSAPRPVIYRYVDVIRCSFALLEALHFELFMPDRPYLRFLVVPLATVPAGTIEGDFFRVPDVALLANSWFGVKLGDVRYPVVWKVKGAKKIEVAPSMNKDGLAYILKKDRLGGEVALSDVCDQDFFIRETLFPEEYLRREHSLVRVTMQYMFTAHLHPVESPLPPPSRDDYVIDMLQSLSKQDVRLAYKKFTKEDTLGMTDTYIREHLKYYVHQQALLEILYTLDKQKRAPYDGRSEYLKRVCSTRTSSQRSGRVPSAVHALSASEADRIADRLGGFTTYGEEGDVRLMDELFQLGSRYRVSVSASVDSKDAGETIVDESIILKTIMDEQIASLEECRPLLDWIYDRRFLATVPPAVPDLQSMELRDGNILTLNAQQSHALRLYADADGPRVFCILSPPGSGKTTVAAAMAATVGREGQLLQRTDRRRGRAEEYYENVQLLLSVQNVAVDNMGSALKNMDYGGGDIYNMKSAKKLNCNDPAPFDFFDVMEGEQRDKWKKGTITWNASNSSVRGRYDSRNSQFNEEKKKMSGADMEECITHYRREYEGGVTPKIVLSTVEMVLQKMYTPSKLVSCLQNVKRVIIDEASLLTEAALFCVIRRFPNARIVLIGDDHQLPPFMYDEKILGHELAGRPALTVAMKTGRVPVVELNEVYRAPPSLVAPYNRLAYGGRLVSRKAEGASPLSEIGLIHRGMAQLLLIDVDGREQTNERTKSVYNERELDVLIRLLKKFPREWAKHIMIICLYKEQKKKLHDKLNREFGYNCPFDKQYTVLTVDSAQGKESPIVILMTTRTQRATDFFCSYERCNVAVSRQQKALIIVGKDSLLTTNKPWSTVVNGDDFTRIKAENI